MMATFHRVAFAGMAGLLGIAGVAAADWMRAGFGTNQPVWGSVGGLQFAIAPAGFRPNEPRGLIRVGYPILRSGRYDLVNFIAVEPVVDGEKGFSELERSRLDDVPGKRFSVSAPLGSRSSDPPLHPVRPDLHAGVNARFTYWMSRRPIPGGIAFENFELRESFYEGQEFTFGISRKEPHDLGFTRDGPEGN